MVLDGDVETTFELRPASLDDYPAIKAALDDWWTLPSYTTPEAKRERTLLLPRLWLQHFASTSLVATAAPAEGGGLRGFLVGFHSIDRADESYIHFVGVHPAARKARIGRRLYERFFEACRAHGRRRVRCITSPTNEVSLAFHRALGFSIEKGDKTVNGVDVLADYDGPGFDRIAFVRVLS
jgi:ribosomal protein S18 acetylase RimI-like enzyme